MIHKYDPKGGKQMGTVASAVTTRLASRGIAIAGDYVYQAQDLDDGHSIHKTRKQDGSILQTISHSGTSPAIIATDETHLYVLDAEQFWIQKRLLSSAGHEVIGQFSFRSLPTRTDGHGLTFAGGFLYMATVANRKVFKLDPDNGDVLATFDLPDSIPPSVPIIDLAYGGGNFWFLAANGRLYRALTGWELQ